MPDFDSVAALEKYVVGELKYAAIELGDKTTDVFLSKADDFYGEYEPKSYSRTMTFRDSIRLMDIVSIGNGWAADVGFDESMTSHPGAGLSEHEIMYMNTVEGTHGRYEYGTAVFVEGVGDVTGKINGMARDALISTGLPVE